MNYTVLRRKLFLFFVASILFACTSDGDGRQASGAPGAAVLEAAGAQEAEPIGMTPEELATPSGATYASGGMATVPLNFEGKIPVGGSASGGLPAQEGRQGAPDEGQEETSRGANLPAFQEVVSSAAQSLANLPSVPPPVARLRVALTDLAIDSVDSLLVTFNRVDVKFTPESSTESQIVTLAEGARTEDFILLSKGILKPVGDVDFDQNGTVNQVRLIVKSAQIRFKGETAYEPVKIPSGSETGLKLIGNIPMKIGKRVQLVVDFDVERSITVLGNGDVHMKPTIKVFSLDEAHELGLPEGNHKVLIASASDSPDPMAPGNPYGRGERLDQDVKFTTELRKTGEITNSLPGEHSFFAWNLAFSSFKKALLVREFSDTKELTGTITTATPDPIPFPVTVNFDGRDKPTDGKLLPDGLYIYVVNTVAYVTTDPKQPDKGKGQGGGGQAETRILDRDKFYGSARIDNTLPALAFTKPGSRFIFSHDRVETELFAKDPLAGEDSNSGLNPDTFKASISNGEFPATTPKDIADLLAPSRSGYAPEPFASRGPDLLVEFTRSGLLTEATPCNCVREGVNILRATIEDNAENERKATGLKFLVDRVKPEGGWETPPFALVPANGDGFITNSATATFQVRFTDPMPKGLNTASGLREDTVRILFQNKTGYVLDRRIGDGQIPALESNPVEFTNPFGEAIAGDVVPLTTRLKIAGLSLPDGNYTATAFLADRATASGDAYSAGQLPVNMAEAKVEFCLDRALPGVAGLDLSSPVASSSTDPSFIPSAVPNVTVQCADPAPSCGLKTLTLVAVRTHAPAPYPGAGPIDTIDETNNIKLDSALCDNQTHTFAQPLGEGKWDFRLEVTDKAGNKSSLSKNGIFLDETTPFTSDIMVLSAAQSVPLPDTSLSLPTNHKFLRVGVKYANGLSGVNSMSVGFSYSGPVCGASVPVLAADSHEALSEAFAPCEGANTVSVLFRDNAGNQGSNMRTFVADFSPPIVKITSVRRLDGTMVVSGLATDESGIAYLRIDGIGLTLQNGAFTSPTIPIADKASVLVEFSDIAGNSGSLEIPVPLTGDFMQVEVDSEGRPAAIEWSTADGQTSMTGDYKYHPDLPASVVEARVEIPGKGTIVSSYDYDGNCGLSDFSTPNENPGDVLRCITRQSTNADGTTEQYRIVYDTRILPNGTSEIVASDSFGARDKLVINLTDNTVIAQNALGHEKRAYFESVGPSGDGGTMRRLARTEEPNGLVTEYQYSPSGIPLATVQKSGGPDGEVSLTALLYDDENEPTALQGSVHDNLTSLSLLDGSQKVSAIGAGDRPAIVINDSLNADGNIVKRTQTTDESEASTEFDSSGRPTRTEERRDDGEQTTTSFAYGTLGRTTSIVTDGIATSMEYDGNSQRVKTIRENGAPVATFEYDSSGHLTTYTSEGMSQRRLDFDLASGRPKRVRVELGNQAVEYKMDYDVNGRLIKETRPDGGEFRQTYDAIGRPTRVVAPDGATTAMSYDVLGRAAASTYTASGRGQEVVTESYDGQNDLGLQTTQADVGRLTGVRVVGSDYARAISWSKAGYEKTVEHDIEGRRFHLDYTRDMEGDITRIAYPDGTAVVYSDVDNKVTFGNQTVLNSAVLSGERVIQATYANGLQLNTYKDIKGNLNSLVLTDSSGNVVRAYEVERSGKEIVREKTESGDISYSYDPQGRLTRVDRPDNTSAAYQYDSLGNRLYVTRSAANQGTATTSYRYGPNESCGPTNLTPNRLCITGDARGSKWHSYDGAGRVIARHFGEVGANISPVRSQFHSYNARGLLNILTERENWTGETEWISRYSYDEQNRRVYKSFELPRYRTPSGERQCRWEFRYVYGGGDFLGQHLLRENVTAVSQGVPDVFTGYREYVWMGSELVAIREKFASSNSSNFHCPEALDADGLGTMTFDPSYQFAGSSGAGAYRVTIPRLKFLGEEYSQVRAVVGNHVYLEDISYLPGSTGHPDTGHICGYSPGCTGLDVVLLRDSSGVGYAVLTDDSIDLFPAFLRSAQFIARIRDVFIPQSGVSDWKWNVRKLHRPLPLPVRDGFFFVHNDLRGVPVALSNTAGQVVWQRTVDEFGRTNDFRVPFVLPGQYADFESGYYYNVNRYYDPEIGRYLQPDPLGGIYPYSYANNNPIRFSDPLGAFAIAGFLKGRVEECYYRTPSGSGGPHVPPPRCHQILDVGTIPGINEDIHEQITRNAYRSAIGKPNDKFRLEGGWRFSVPVGSFSVDTGGNTSIGIYDLEISSNLSFAFSGLSTFSLVGGVVDADLKHGLTISILGRTYDPAFHFDSNRFPEGYAKAAETPRMGTCEKVCKGCVCSTPMCDKWKEKCIPWCPDGPHDPAYCVKKAEVRMETVSYACKKPIRSLIRKWKVLGYYDGTCTKRVPKREIVIGQTTHTCYVGPNDSTGWLCNGKCQRETYQEKCGETTCVDRKDPYPCNMSERDAGLFLHPTQDFWAHTTAVEQIEKGGANRERIFGQLPIKNVFFSGSFDGNSWCKALLADMIKCGSVGTGKIIDCRLPRETGMAHCEVNKDKSLNEHYLKAWNVSAAVYQARHLNAKQFATEDSAKALTRWCALGTLEKLCY